jgi:hypothetical protein
MSDDVKLQKDEMKAAFKEAAKEFFAEKWTEYTSSVGKWVIGLVAAAFVLAVAWMILTANGWKAP